MCLPMLAPLGTALLGGAVTGGAAAAAGTMAIFGPLAQGMLTIGAQGQQASMQAKAQRRATIAENARYSQQVSAMRTQQATGVATARPGGLSGQPGKHGGYGA